MKDEQKIIGLLDKYRSGGGSEWFLLDPSIEILQKLFDVSRYFDRDKPPFYSAKYTFRQLDNMIAIDDECSFVEETFHDAFYKITAPSEFIDDIDISHGLDCSAALPHNQGDTHARKAIPHLWDEYTERAFYNYMPTPSQFNNEVESAIAMLLTKRAFESVMLPDPAYEAFPIVAGSDTDFWRIFYSDSKPLHDHCRRFSERFWFYYDCYGMCMSSVIVDSTGCITGYTSFGNKFNTTVRELLK